MASEQILAALQARRRAGGYSDTILKRAGVGWRICHLCFCATLIKDNQCGACGGKVIH